MAADDQKDDPPAPKPRRRKPPVIELEATEIPSAVPPPRPEAAASTTDPEERSFEWRALLSFAPAATAAAAIVGAVVAILVVFLFDRGNDPRVATLVNEVAALNQRIEVINRAGGADPAALAQISEKIDRIAGMFAEAEKRVAGLESKPAPVMPDLSPLAARLERLDEALGKQIGALEERVNALSVNARASVAPALAAEIVALGTLRDAIHSGAPFSIELAAARALLGERAAKLQSLESAAGAGVPTLAQLSRRFAELASGLARAPDAHSGYLSRLVTSATRLVEVRPVGENKGESAGAVVARIEARLQQNDLAGALDEAAHLPASAKTIAADWIALAMQKRDADRAVKDLIAASLVALGAERRP
jgi:hypothetical protein